MYQKAGKAIEPVMLANLARAIDFVKFGEAKNAALLTFASAWILAAATLAMNPIARALPQILWGLIFGVPCFVIAASLAMMSFLPQIDPDRITGDKQGDRQIFSSLAISPKGSLRKPSHVSPTAMLRKRGANSQTSISPTWDVRSLSTAGLHTESTNYSSWASMRF